MVQALALILGLQLAGEALSAALGLPIPGPVLGMTALLAILALSGGPSPALEETSGAFLSHLGLLFVPAGVGVTLHLGRVGQEWLAVALALLVGTAISIVVVAWTFERIAGPAAEAAEAEDD